MSLLKDRICINNNPSSDKGPVIEYREEEATKQKEGEGKFYPYKRGGGWLAMLKGGTISLGYFFLIKELDVLAILKGGGHKMFPPFTKMFHTHDFPIL